MRAPRSVGVRVGSAIPLTRRSISKRSQSSRSSFLAQPGALPLQRQGPPEDRRKRGAKLMGHRRQERAPQFIQLAQALRRQSFRGQSPLELQSPKPYPLFQLLVLLPELEMKLPNLQHVVNPEENLLQIEGFGEEVLRSSGQSFPLDLGRDVGGEYQDGQIAARRDQSCQLVHHLEAVEVRHEQVQKDQVRLELCQQTGDTA